jgi:hypothetical protein
MQVLLRGAIEYDHDVDYWWERLSDESRRWVSLHALRSENAPARVRALERLAWLPDEIGVIPLQIAQALQGETNEQAFLAALKTLNVRSRMVKPVFEVSLDTKAKSRTTQVVHMITTQLQLRAVDVWREVVFTPEIDLLLADFALNSNFASVREEAARTIGRINSLTAVRQIAEEQRRGAKGALRALALVRDEAVSLPNVVSPRARLYAWLANTWRRLTDRPLQIVWRYLLALLGAFIAIAANTYITYRTENFLNPARWKLTISVGLVTAVLVGLLAVIGDEFPSRLRGFWPWWARLLLSAGLAFAGGVAAWGVYTYLYLEYPPEGVTFFAAAGIGFGLVATSMFNLPGWLAFLVTAIATYIPLYVAFQNFMPPVLYYDNPDQIFILAIPVALLIALGIHAQALARDVRRVFKRTQKAPA